MTLFKPGMKYIYIKIFFIGVPIKKQWSEIVLKKKVLQKMMVKVNYNNIMKVV